jgi:hypothetical protein
MIRFFDWRDVGLVKTLADQGVCLDSETGLTQGNHPLQHALVSYLMPMAGAPTLIWRADGDHSAVFGQLSHRQGEEHARVLYIAPAAEAGGDGWQQLIERLAVEAGERRAQNLIAEVNEKSPESEALRQAGFAIYARQTLWKLAAREAATKASVTVAVRPAERSDTIGVNTLYSNVVPRLVQQVEPGPQHIERGYVLEDGGELVAFLDVRRGPQGIWVEPFLHPEAYDLTEAVLETCLQLLPSPSEKPLYLCVRRYQDWLQNVMPRVGFEPLGSQVVMVKRLAVRIMEPAMKPRAVVEGHASTAIPSAQFTPHDDAPRDDARRPGYPSNGTAHYRWPTHAKANYR